MRLRMWSPSFKVTSRISGHCCPSPCYEAQATTALNGPVFRRTRKVQVSLSPKAMVSVLPVYFRGWRELWDIWICSLNVFSFLFFISFLLLLFYFLEDFLDFTSNYSLDCFISPSYGQFSRTSTCSLFLFWSFLISLYDYKIFPYLAEILMKTLIIGLFSMLSLFLRDPFFSFFPFILFAFSPLQLEVSKNVWCALVPCLYLKRRF